LTWMLKPRPHVKPSPIEPKITEEIDLPTEAERYRELRAKADEAEANLPERFRDAMTWMSAVGAQWDARLAKLRAKRA